MPMKTLEEQRTAANTLQRGTLIEVQTDCNDANVHGTKTLVAVW